MEQQEDMDQGGGASSGCGINSHDNKQLASAIIHDRRSGGRDQEWFCTKRLTFIVNHMSYFDSPSAF